ncbi:MAG: hydrogenase maturation nickel metallochaperone HypA [Dethiobacter sp.]|nr:MAG: hydrogenase maturation nickel metallochaperone HypA [Dethiobacter sp.]
MHELSLVSSLMQIIGEDARKRGLQKINRVSLIIGEMSTSSSRAIEFALEHLCKGTILDGAAFEITIEELQGKCDSCSLLFKPSPPFFLCPSCGKGCSSFTKGRQVYIDFYEGE